MFVPNSTNGAESGRNAVYIIDDDVDVRESLTFFLSAAGFTARAFAEPMEFLAAVSQLAPGCVLLDIRMPGVDGFEVLERLRLAEAALPVVVITGHGDVVVAVRAMKLGASDFLEKPFEEDMLLRILSQTFAALENNRYASDRRRHARARLEKLSEREREVLVALLAGRSNKVVAFELGISVRTVEMHRAAMMERLLVRTFADALRLALDGGIELGAVAAPTVADLPR